MSKKSINYSHSWEDPTVLTDALAIGANDRVLSITSGGDNSLALLLMNPQEVIAIDRNPAQSYLLELKKAAAIALPYDVYRAFLGVTASDKRMDLFETISRSLSPDARKWWREHPSYVAKGVIHSGRFERFIGGFARFVLPIIHSKKKREALLSFSEPKAQEEFYRREWNTLLWRLLFSLASSRFTLRKYARDEGMFSYAEVENIPNEYKKRLEKMLFSVPARTNFFLHYAVTGNYSKTLPPYLEQKGYEALRQNDRLSIVTADLTDYLKTVPDDYFSAYNLSDISEALSPEEHGALWKEIVRTAKSGARVAYWTNLVSRPVPAPLQQMVTEEKETAETLRRKDRVFFYGGFHVYSIQK
jgi:S-adenosylmethionine-diacylglycerol 3-amino-3-carboxypropyl transferase